MSLDDYITRVPDDDPDGETELQTWLSGLCPDCGADPDTPCEQHCQCVYCKRRRALEHTNATTRPNR